MFVYRVENSRRIGPYHSDFCSKHNEFNLYDWDRCPGPSYLDIPTGYRFGFSSTRQLKSWFWGVGCRKVMMDEGFRFKKFLVNKKYVKILSKQLMFQRNKAKEIKSFTFS